MTRAGWRGPGSFPGPLELTPRGVCPQDPLLRVQEALNGTEVSLQHLTALVDCRSLHLVRGLGGLRGPGPSPAAASPLGRGGQAAVSGAASPASPSHPAFPSLPVPVGLAVCPRRPQDYVQALTGFCYDGVEGLIYLALFSFVTALMFSSIVCSVPHTWQQKR